MSREQANKIVEVWERVQEQHPGKSTEFLLWVTATDCHIQNVFACCDVADVAEALYRTNQL